MTTTTTAADSRRAGPGPVLTVEHLDVIYQVAAPVHAVRDVSLTLGRVRSSAWRASRAAARPLSPTRSIGCTDHPRRSRRAR